MSDLVLVAGHAIWEGNLWKGGYPGQEMCYERHLSDGLSIAKEKDAVLILSGGHTRPHLDVERSEAEGMKAFIREHFPGHPLPVLCENYARDSFENVLFSYLLFYQTMKEWPENLIIVSFGFKRLRFGIIRVGMKIPRFQFFGSGDKYLSMEDEEGAIKGEFNIMNRIMNSNEGKIRTWNPLHREKFFQEKREERMPKGVNESSYMNEVKKCYGFEDLLFSLQSISEGPQWEDMKWPWENN